MEEFPGFTGVYNSFYNLKRTFIPLSIIFIFLFMAYLQKRSIIGFGILIISHLIFYYEVHPKSNNFGSLFLWKIMNFYSMIIIIAFFVYLFCNLDWFEKYFSDKYSSKESIFYDPTIYGFKKIDDPNDLENDVQGDLFPIFVFFLLSKYICDQMSQWKKDDKERNQNDKLGDEVYINPS